MKFSHFPSVIFLSIFVVSVLTSGCGKDRNPAKTLEPEFKVHSAFVGFTNHYLDLESGLIDTIVGPDIPNQITDLRNEFSSFRTTHTTIIQLSGREIAYFSDDVAFSDVTVADLDSVTFTELTIDISFEPTTILLLKTDQKAIYKLGNPVEDIDGVRFDYQLLLAAEVP